MRLPPGTPEPPGGPSLDRPQDAENPDQPADADNAPPGGRAAERQRDFMERRYPGGIPPAEDMPLEELPPETIEQPTEAAKPKRKGKQPKAAPGA